MFHSTGVFFIYFAFVFCFFIGQRPDNYRSDTQENHHAQFCDHSHRHRGANLGHATGKPRRVSASALTSELHGHPFNTENGNSLLSNICTCIYKTTAIGNVKHCRKNLVALFLYLWTDRTRDRTTDLQNLKLTHHPNTFVVTLGLA